MPSSPAKRLKVYEKGGGVCWLCHRPLTLEEMSLDHVIPRSLGGGFRIANLMPAHKVCNAKRGNKAPTLFNRRCNPPCGACSWCS